jgi:hypothetical protein
LKLLKFIAIAQLIAGFLVFILAAGVIIHFVLKHW